MQSGTCNVLKCPNVKWFVSIYTLLWYSRPGQFQNYLQNIQRLVSDVTCLQWLGEECCALVKSLSQMSEHRDNSEVRLNIAQWQSQVVFRGESETLVEDWGEWNLSWYSNWGEYMARGYSTYTTEVYRIGNGEMELNNRNWCKMLRLYTGCLECGTVAQIHRISGKNATKP